MKKIIAVLVVLLVVFLVLQPHKKWVMHAYPRPSADIQVFQIPSGDSQGDCEDLGHNSERMYGGSYVCILE